MDDLLRERAQMKRHAILLVLATACSTTAAPFTPSDAGPDAGASPAPDAGSPVDAGVADAGRPPAVTSVERFGQYMPTRTRAVLPGLQRSFVLFGEVGVHIDAPETFGLPSPSSDGVVVAGLVVLDTATGHTQRYTDADGLPKMTYDGMPVPATVPFFDLTWITPDQVFAAASWAYVVRGEIDAQSRWHFRSKTVRAPGASADASITSVAVAGGELFLGSDQGVAVLNPATLDVIRWVDLRMTRPWVRSVSAAHVKGEAVVVLFSEAGANAPTNVSLALPGTTSAEPVPLPANAKPTVVAGLTGSVLIGATGVDGRGFVNALVESASGLDFTTMIDADKLGALTPRGKPFIPNRIAFDPVHGKLLVGGQISSTTIGRSGGLLEFDMVSNGQVNGPGRFFFDRRDPYETLLPWEVLVLVPDALGRWYVGGNQLCNEHKAKVVGVVRVEQDGAERRLVRPFVSGVRSITVDPVEGQTWLGLRDEIPGLSCDGYTVQQHVCRLKADGSCEIYPSVVNANVDVFGPAVGASAIAFGDTTRHEMAIATRRDASFVRIGDTTRALMSQISPGVSLFQTAAAWSNGGLWLGSEMSWDVGVNDPNDPNPIDWDKVNDRSPHSLGYLEFNADGTESLVRRYVRKASDSNRIDVAGMASNTVWDVLPLPGARHALVALGFERDSRNYDHVLPAVNSHHFHGGLSEVSDTTIKPIAEPAGVTWGDVVAIARTADGAILALDAEAGLFRVDLASGKADRWAAPAWTAPGRARAMAIDGAGRVAVATTSRVFIYGPNGAWITATDGKDGGFWSARFVADGVLYAGADQGLVRVVLGDAVAPRLGASAMLPRELWPLPLGCHGEEGCACTDPEQCAAGSDCACTSPSECVCKATDPCAADPGGPHCACKLDLDCDSGLVCACDARGTCGCEKSAACTTQGCKCHQDSDCDPALFCRSGIAGGTCDQR